jgi:hypothetical protein
MGVCVTHMEQILNFRGQFFYNLCKYKKIKQIKKEVYLEIEKVEFPLK